MKNMTITEYNTCNCEHITNPEGFQVCRQCGLVNEINFNSPKPKILPDTYLLGTYSTPVREWRFDYSNKLTNDNAIFNRLSIYNYIEFTNREKVIIRNIDEGIRICIALDLPAYIIDGCIFKFKKLNRIMNIKNCALCFFYCIWETTRYFKVKIPLIQLMEEYNLRGHLVTNRRLNKTAEIYREVLKEHGIPVTLPLSNRDYIEFYSTILLENHELCQEQINKFDINMLSEEFVNETIQLAYEMYDMLNDKGLIQGGMPKGIAGATLYAANLVLTRRYSSSTRKAVISQVLLGSILDLWNSTIKENYLKFFKRFIIK